MPDEWLNHIPKFDDDPSSNVAHIVEFTKLVLCFGAEQEDVVVQLFLLSFEER